MTVRIAVVHYPATGNVDRLAKAGAGSLNSPRLDHRDETSMAPNSTAKDTDRYA
ncbi:MAG: hypothetical protein ABJB47_13450 [Actinomycetota bacterium]